MTRSEIRRHIVVHNSPGFRGKAGRVAADDDADDVIREAFENAESAIKAVNDALPRLMDKAWADLPRGEYNSVPDKYDEIVSLINNNSGKIRCIG